MINHARTLLLNLSGIIKPDSTYFGEEYVPSGYVKLDYNPRLLLLRSLLFGRNPDRAKINYRLRELLNLVHSIPEFEAYLLNLDSRITYWPSKDASLFQTASYGAFIEVTSGPDDWILSITGDLQNLTSNSNLLDTHQIEILTSSTLKISHLINPQSNITANYILTDGVSNNIFIPYSKLGFTFSPNTTGFPIWQIQTVSRPNDTLIDVYLDIQNHERTGLTLFGVGDSYTYLQEVWNTTVIPWPHRFAAVIVSFIYQLEDFRIKGY